MPQANAIPQELINTIIDHIPEDSSNASRNTILACTHVSRSFRHPARRRLFSTINLAMGIRAPVSEKQRLNTTVDEEDEDEDEDLGVIGPRSVLQFLRLQGGSDPHTASERLSFVHTLHLHMHSSVFYDRERLFDDFSKAPEVIYQGALNLETLRMSSSPTGARIEMPPKFVLKFIRLLTASGRIKYLRMDGLKQVHRDFLMVCPALRRLQVNRVRLEDSQFPVTQPDAVGGVRRPLETLFVDQPFGPIFPMLTYVPSEFDLKKFRTRLRYPQCILAVQDVLRRWSKGLTSLDLVYTNLTFKHQLSLAPINLDLLPALTSIKFAVTMQVPDVANILHPTRVLEVLTASTRPSTIESIELRYRCLLTTVPTDDVFGPPVSGTDSNLHIQHPRLKKLHLRYDIIYVEMAAYPAHPSGLPAFFESVVNQIQSSLDLPSLNQQVHLHHEAAPGNLNPADFVDLQVQVYDYRSPAFFRLWGVGG